jgi:hypothetical protein
MRKPKEANDRAVWWDIHLDAAAWYRTETVTPLDAALLLSGHNPNRETALEAAQLNTGACIGPDNFQLLLNVFEGAELTQRRSLPDWIAYASERGLSMHPWVEEFNEAFVSAYVISPGMDNSGDIPTSQKKRRSWGDRELNELWQQYIQPDMTQQKLGNAYGVSRQLIGKLLKKAKPLKVGPSSAFTDSFKKHKIKK